MIPGWLSAYLKRRRQARAHRRLARLIRQRRDSFEIQQFRQRRAAALKHSRGLAQ